MRMRLFDFKEAAVRIARAAPDFDSRAGAKTQAASEEFACAVERAGWRLLRPGARPDVAAAGAVTIVGAAPWSDPDVEALDEFARGAATGMVYAFSIDDCRSMSDIRAFMPGLAENILETPCVAQYRDGALIRSAQGKRALTWLTTGMQP